MDQQLKPLGFADAMRSWRLRRRVSQLELAARAGTTQRHISFVESGRSVPGRAMVVRIAESLEVPLRHRNSLLLAAGYAPVYEESPLADPGLSTIRAALENVLRGHLPYPAVVVDRYGDLVTANRAFWPLAAGAAAELLEPPVSLPRLLLHPDGMAPDIANLDDWAWHIMNALQRQAERDPSDRLDALIAELENHLSPRPRPGPDHVGFAVPLRLRRGDRELRLVTTLTHFGTATDVTVSELRLEAFLPADDATAEFLTRADSAPRSS